VKEEVTEEAIAEVTEEAIAEATEEAIAEAIEEMIVEVTKEATETKVEKEGIVEKVENHVSL
jgi:hypothetical protein